MTPSFVYSYNYPKSFYDLKKDAMNSMVTIINSIAHILVICLERRC